MDLYTCWACRAPRRPSTSNGRTAAWCGGITRASIPGITSPSRCSGASCRPTRCSVTPSGVGNTTVWGRRLPGPSRPSVLFEGFDFSAPAEGPDAATFSELFADVFQEAARQATSPSRGVALEATLRLSFEDAVRGGSFPLSVVRQDRCGVCAGDGRVPREPVVCPTCEGRGANRWARGHMVFARSCDGCSGTGRLLTRPCRACGGSASRPAARW